MDVEQIKRELEEGAKRLEPLNKPCAGGVILDRPTAAAFERLAKRVAALEEQVQKLSALSGTEPTKL